MYMTFSFLHDGLRERPATENGRAQPCASPSRRKRGHGEREGACSYFSSWQVQRTHQFWLLTFWLLTFPFLYRVLKSVFCTLHSVKTFLKSTSTRRRGAQQEECGQDENLWAKKAEAPIGGRFYWYVEGFESVLGALVVFKGVWNPKCHPTNSTSTVARGLSNLRATAHSATLHGASATSG